LNKCDRCPFRIMSMAGMPILTGSLMIVAAKSLPDDDDPPEVPSLVEFEPPEDEAYYVQH